MEWLRHMLRGRGSFSVGDRVRSKVDGLYGVVVDRRERGGVLVYSVKLDDPESSGPVYGFLHEFEMARADKEHAS